MIIDLYSKCRAANRLLERNAGSTCNSHHFCLPWACRLLIRKPRSLEPKECSKCTTVFMHCLTSSSLRCPHMGRPRLKPWTQLATSYSRSEEFSHLTGSMLCHRAGLRKGLLRSQEHQRRHIRQEVRRPVDPSGCPERRGMFLHALEPNFFV